jgi:hypothetical protein
MFKYFKELLTLLRSINSNLIQVNKEITKLSSCVIQEGHFKSRVRTDKYIEKY